jgi:hypothetical protein
VRRGEAYGTNMKYEHAGFILEPSYWKNECSYTRESRVPVLHVDSNPEVSLRTASAKSSNRDRPDRPDLMEISASSQSRRHDGRTDRDLPQC